MRIKYSKSKYFLTYNFIRLCNALSIQKAQTDSTKNSNEAQSSAKNCKESSK